MNPFLFTALVLLGVGATFNYFLGVKKNRWLGKRMSTQAENILKPRDTEYVNIGGAIGYHIKYKLREPWKEAKGTFTFFPRHSLLYMPISLLIGGSDRFYLNLFTDRRLAGEGHIIEQHHLRKAKIDGFEEMETEEVEYGGRTFTLAWRHANLRDALHRTLQAMPEPETLVHFTCFDENKAFFLFLRPKNGNIERNLEAFMVQCAEYFR